MLLVIRELLSGVHRFDDIRRALGVVDKVLSSRLQSLVTDGLVERQAVAAGRIDRVECIHTQTAALPILHAYALWAQKYATMESQPPLIIACLTCGEESSRGELCSECGAPLNVQNVAWTRPLAVDRQPQPLQGPASN